MEECQHNRNLYACRHSSTMRVWTHYQKNKTLNFIPSEIKSSQIYKSLSFTDLIVQCWLLLCPCTSCQSVLFAINSLKAQNHCHNPIWKRILILLKKCKWSNLGHSYSLFLFVIPPVLANLQVDFYKSTCPQAESIVQQVVKNEFSRDLSITAAFLRMHFHDCFVRVSYYNIWLWLIIPHSNYICTVYTRTCHHMLTIDTWKLWTLKSLFENYLFCCN